MRKSALILTFLLMVPGAYAQQKNGLSAFLSYPSGWGGTNSGLHIEGGFGVAFSHTFSPLFSVEASLSQERYTLFRQTPVSDGAFRYDQVSVRTNPFDITGRYHFQTEGRWRPYVGAGARYVSTNEVGRGGFSTYRLFRLEPEVSGGVVFQLRPHAGIVFDAKQLIGNNNLRSDPAFKPSIGFRWTF